MIAIPQLFASRRPETEYEAEFPLSASFGQERTVEVLDWPPPSGRSSNRRSVCIIHTIQSRELIKLLQADGWQLKRTRGSHHQFEHPTKPGTVTVPHPKKDLGKGLVQAIRKQAGLK
ncbi:MAG: type II toxin-antitoxin system HicA family toxin [Steroidobacteraceae bacterium]